MYTCIKFIYALIVRAFVVVTNGKMVPLVDKFRIYVYIFRIFRIQIPVFIQECNWFLIPLGSTFLGMEFLVSSLSWKSELL